MNRTQLRMGQAGIGLKELVATLVVSAILIIVGIFVYSKVAGVFEADTSVYTGNASATVVNVSKTTYDAFTLASVAMIILAAAVIVGILIRAFGA
jgi:hypothetical protein